MKKIVLCFLAIVGGISILAAQSLEDGVKALYYQKYSSAEQTLQKVVDKNPKDGQSVYWLGQVYLQNTFGETDGVTKAQNLYQKSQAGPTDPWILVGLGQVDYINHNPSAAEQKFEQALTASKSFRGKHKEEDQAALMTAIGRASSYGNKDIGDPAYAIPVLQKAMDLDKTNPEPALYLGLNYRKLGGDQGGNAFVAFNTAATRDPKYAAADYEMGRIFHAQDNFEVMDQWYQKGIQADPTYGPIYLDYFDYYKFTDKDKAKGFLDKYVANSDNGCGVQYFQAEYLFRAGSYQESINKGKQMESSSCGTYPHLPLLLAVNYHRLGDTANAVSYAKKFFSTVSASNILPDDYAFGGFIYKDAPGLADTAVVYLRKAYDMDTAKADKDLYADSIAYALDKANKPVEKYKWLRKLYDDKDTATRTNLDIFNVGTAALDVARTSDPSYFPIADSMFTLYKKKYPDQSYGYNYLMQSKLAQDTTSIEKAIPAINDYIGFLSKDTVKYKDVLIEQYGTLANYYVNVKQDYPAGLQMFDKILALDPTNAAAKQYGDQIRAFLTKKNAPATPSKKSPK